MTQVLFKQGWKVLFYHFTNKVGQHDVTKKTQKMAENIYN